MPRGMRRAGWKAVVAMSAALLLAGCAASPAPAVTTASATPRASAVISSDVAAVNAATSLYKTYLRASDAVLNDGGSEPQRLKPYLTSAQYARESSTMASLRASGNHLQGEASVIATKAQDVQQAKGLVVLYLCLDASHTRVLNSKGKDVTPSDRPMKRTLLVGFVSADHRLLINSSTAWSGASVCP